MKELYATQVSLLTAQISALKKRSRWLVAGELLTFLLAFGLLFIPLYAVSALLLVAYIVVRRWDGRNSEHIEQLEDRRSVYQRELCYLSGDYSPFDAGERYVDPQHPYAYDLDIFGPDSLYQRLNRTITSGGSDRLAHYLQHADQQPTALRREAIRELAQDEPWRSGFLALGQRQKIDSQGIVSVLRLVSQLRLPTWLGSGWVLAVAYVALAVLYALIGLAVWTPLPASIPLTWTMLLLVVVFVVASRPLQSIGRAVSQLHQQLVAYVRLIRQMDTDFQSAELRRLKGVLLGDGEDALHSFRQLEEILDDLDRRGSEVRMTVFNIFLLSDVFLVRKFLRWQGAYLGHIGEWVDAVSQVDALVSMATYRANEPSCVDAEVTDADTVVYEAHDLRHPFLGPASVGNDFTVDDGRYYIITGANMAGKSTFLRSVGISYVMALNGLPVLAGRLRLSRFSLFSSMRTTDDLAHGISYFNAELLRLRQLIRHCQRQPRTLIILDEILKGTNSLDKLNGSRLFLQEMAQLPVTGIVATHDLELSRLADEQPSRFQNHCFEIELGREVTYTYKMTPGVARNQNATFLLQGILEEIHGG